MGFSKERFRQRLAMLIREAPMLRELRALAEQVAKNTEAVRALQEQVAAPKEDFNRLSRRVEVGLSALGRRWGLMSEEAFRAAMEGMLEEFGFRVMGRLTLRDEWGIVDPEEPGALYGYDLCIARDGREWVVEVKAHVSCLMLSTSEAKASLNMPNTVLRA